MYLYVQILLSSVNDTGWPSFGNSRGSLFLKMCTCINKLFIHFQTWTAQVNALIQIVSIHGHCLHFTCLEFVHTGKSKFKVGIKIKQ